MQIRADLSRREAIALIGHELQHALEIADATEVRDTTSLVRLYERIGHMSIGEHAYDTEAARDTGRVVRRELAAELTADRLPGSAGRAPAHVTPSSQHRHMLVTGTGYT